MSTQQHLNFMGNNSVGIVPGFLQAGMTLLELMISLALGLMLLTGIGTIYVGSNQTYRVQEQNARIQESGRYALEIIGRSLRQAGYWDIPAFPPDALFTVGGAPIEGDATSVTVRYDGTGGSDCSGAVVAVGTVVQEVFDLNANNLRCNDAPLIADVEDLQFLYGIDTDGNQSANQYLADPDAAELSLVVSVRACVLIRSNDTGIATSDQSYLNCAGALGTATGAAALTTAADRLLRRTFVATFNLRNRVTNLP